MQNSRYAYRVGFELAAPGSVLDSGKNIALYRMVPPKQINNEHNILPPTVRDIMAAVS
jgi:hypothetical protein